MIDTRLLIRIAAVTALALAIYLVAGELDARGRRRALAARWEAGELARLQELLEEASVRATRLGLSS